ncbi:MBL fold metallo-hydrolase, partial [Gammaproteobacteria bacterium]|nr:MBL fold metallo-hydrolase [Gammaproteobacteria bacterium]
MKNKCEVIFLGHAGFLIEADIRLLCDPWATKNGAMLGAWHQLPDNCDYIESNKSVLTAEFVWLSHEHTDHFDIEFLSKLPQETVFILPKFLTNNMPRALSQHGFRNIVLLDNGDRFELSPDITVNMILEEPVWSEHSSLVIRSRETVLLHNSDSYLTKAQLTKIKATYKPNIYIGQYSATSPFPDVMKEWNESQKSGFRNKHLAWAMNRFVESVQYCGAETAIPCAGPAVVVEPRRLEVSRQKANLVGGCMNLEELFGQLSSRLPRVKIKYLSIGQTIAEGCETPPSPSEVLEAIDRIINERYCLNLSINPSATVEDIRDLHEALFARACKFAPHIISR